METSRAVEQGRAEGEGELGGSTASSVLCDVPVESISLFIVMTNAILEVMSYTDLRVRYIPTHFPYLNISQHISWGRGLGNLTLCTLIPFPWPAPIKNALRKTTLPAHLFPSCFFHQT